MPDYQDQHPDIRIALNLLARCSPAAAGCAAYALRILLRRAYSGGDLQSWSSSRLTGDGFPVEFVFGTADNHLRYTADPGGSSLPPVRRLEDALDLLAELGQSPLDPRLLAYLAASQQSAPTALRYGAWIGARHLVRPGGAGEPAEARFKLYAEIPKSNLASRLPFINSYLALPSRLPGSSPQLTMMAVEPCSGRVEFYFGVRNLEVVSLPSLLDPAGLRPRAAELLDFLADAYSYPLAERIPGGSVGFSYALIPGSDQVAFTLFLFTRLLWGGDARIRQRFCERLQAAGADPTVYSQITAPLSERDVYQTYHGLLGFAVARSSPIQLSLGVRPPPLPVTPPLH